MMWFVGLLIVASIALFIWADRSHRSGCALQGMNAYNGRGMVCVAHDGSLHALR